MNENLANEIQPPDLLKARVSASLRERGLLRRPRSPWRAGVAVAAGLAVFAAGVGVGTGRRPSLRADPGPSFALLLYEGEHFDRKTPEHTYIAEYSAWAAQLRERGLLLSGRALHPASRVMLDSTGRAETRDVASDEGTMAGFFIIRAATVAEAEAIARTCPHLKHGGTVALRQIIPT